MVDQTDVGEPRQAPSPPSDGRLNAQEMQFIERLLDRVDKVHGTFRIELWIYNVGCAAGMALVIFAAVRTSLKGAPGPAELGSFLGAGGLFAVAGDRTTRFLRDNIDILKKVINKVLGLVPGG